MTKSTITRERLEELAAGQSGFNLRISTLEESQQLARMALAAMDSEPVAWTWHYREQWHVTNDERRAEFVATDGDVAVLPLYRHAQTASEREQVRRQHAEWSQATFGNVGPVGPLKHLSKEALEAAAEPGDLSEWADMQFLLWDAQRRAGVTDEQITQAMIDKLAVNKQREWPEPKDGEPRLHIKEQPAPVVPDDLLSMAASAIEDLLEHTDPNTSYYSGVWADVPGKLRAAMLQAGSSPAQSDCCPAQNHASPEQNGDTPAQSQGWIPVSERMPEVEQEVLTINRMGHRFVSFFDKHSGLFFDRLDAPAACCIEHVLVTHWMPLPAAPQEVKSES
ncbi:TPA: dATP/dGTP pyrophosphohydrolase domain-containing protein [Klebsiella pneumoniae]